MKTPIRYYGGKQLMIKDILPMLPAHYSYIEPFVGGGAIFFAKQPARINVINDINSEVINLYEVMKTDMERLVKLLYKTPYSREIFNHAYYISKHPKFFSKLKRAWAFLYGQYIGFSGLPNNYGYGKTPKMRIGYVDEKDVQTTRYINFKERIATDCNSIISLLDKTNIEHDDALKVITRYDCETAFFYCDPPYINTYCGHYAGYTEADYRNLLETLAQLKGKFLLSSFPNEPLKEYVEKYGWQYKEIIKQKCVNANAKDRKEATKTEALAWNYKLGLF